MTEFDTLAREVGHITEADCSNLRAKARRGMSAAKLSKFRPWGERAIAGHIYGGCTHHEDAVGPPAERPPGSPGDGKTKTERVRAYGREHSSSSKWEQLEFEKPDGKRPKRTEGT